MAKNPNWHDYGEDVIKLYAKHGFDFYEDYDIDVVYRHTDCEHSRAIEEYNRLFKALEDKNKNIVIEAAIGLCVAVISLTYLDRSYHSGTSKEYIDYHVPMSMLHFSTSMSGGSDGKGIMEKFTYCPPIFYVGARLNKAFVRSEIDGEYSPFRTETISLAVLPRYIQFVCQQEGIDFRSEWKKRIKHFPIAWPIGKEESNSQQATLFAE